jgi:hypothetical protein
MRSLVILVGVCIVYLSAGAARSWLGDQPAYQLPFREIVLDPPPPSWYRGGSFAFLEDVRRRARMPETIPLLKRNEVKLERAFEQSPWTEEVQRITYQPLGVTVRLAYRRPVALVEAASGRVYLVDPQAVILPQDDLDTEIKQFVRAQGLIEINGRRLADPREPKPGITWQPLPGAADAAPGNDRIPAACRLAGFLVDRMRSIDRVREAALSMRFINPMDLNGRGLFLKNDQSTYILWGEAPGEESPGNLTAEEKWGNLKAWSSGGNTHTEKESDYWEITSSGMILRSYARHPPTDSARVSQPLKDRATIPAKGSGQ